MKKLAAVLLAILLILQMVPLAWAEEPDPVSELPSETEETLEEVREEEPVFDSEEDGDDLITPENDDKDTGSPADDKSGEGGEPTPAANEESDFQYTIENGHVTIDKYIGEDAAVVIPGTIEGYPVTAIGLTAFAYSETLLSVVVPDSVTVIAPRAFEGCSGLTSVNIPEGVTSIGDFAFDSCSSLREITVPGSVSNLGGNLFAETGLTSVTLCSGLPCIGIRMFRGCPDLQTVVLPETVTSIGEWAFGYCGSLKEITIPSGVTTIDDMAFYHADSLTTVFYNGTESDWSSIVIGMNNEALSDADIRFQGTASEGVAISAENFPDEAFRSYVQSRLDTDGDGSLNREEIEKVTYMYVGWSDIASLKGIEFFTSLKEFNCYNNELTDLDLSGNPELEYLDCSNNRLEELNVENDTNLKNLDCSGNQLTELDISGCGKLRKAYYKGEKVSGDGYFEYRYYDENGLIMLRTDSGTTITDLTPAGLLVPISEENFPDEAFRSYVADCIDLEMDGYLSEDETADVTRLEISGRGISSLKGIELFPALTYLNCSNNLLTELDLSGNTGLEYLDCGYNQLTELDISRNTGIYYLICDSNQLEGLDITGNTVLRALYCRECTLTELDVSNSDLTDLGCGDNLLTELDVSGLTALTDLQCGGNQLAELDVSRNTALRFLSCSDNELTELDVSRNTALESLHCSGNQLTELDVSKNTELMVLVCHMNRLEQLNVSMNTKLEELSCHFNLLTELDISRNAALTVLSCGENRLTELDVGSNAVLGTLFCANNPLTSLDISSNKALSALSCICDQLSELDISGCVWLRKAVLSGEKTEHDDFIAYTSDESSLEISIHTTLLGAGPATSGVPVDAETFPDDVFRAYVAENCEVDGDGYLNDAERANVTLIHVPNMQIVSLVGLEHFTALERLDCNDNELTELDVSSNTRLVSLDCQNNRLTSLDVSKNRMLQELYCQDNEITGLDLRGAEALQYVNCISNQLTSLNIEGLEELRSFDCRANLLTSLDVSGCTSLTDLQCYNNQLTSLDVSGAPALIALYCPQNRLTSLDLSQNAALMDLHCGDNLLTSLDLSHNQAMTMLTCSNNQLTGLDLSGCANMYRVNCSNNLLTELNVSGPELCQLYCQGNQLSVLDITGCDCLLLAVAEGAKTEHESYIEYWGPADRFVLRVDPDTVIFTGETGVAIAAEIFPDDVFRSYVRETFDSDGNGFLSDEEIANATEINVTWEDIESLTGLEHFTALKKLSCEGNQLTELDVSKNLLLEELYCGDNRLTELDVSRNTALVWLNCYQNSLTSLDVSGLAALEHLDCRGNRLTSLDLDGCTAMEDLDCNDNQLAEIDTGGLSELVVLDCDSNLLTSLDLSGNPGLQSLYCGKNHLTSLNLNGNQALTFVFCESNPLTSLDLSGNQYLLRLDCKNCGLTDLTISSPNVYHLYCYGNQISVLDISGCDKLLVAYREGVLTEQEEYMEYLNATGGYVMLVDHDTEIRTEPAGGCADGHDYDFVNAVVEWADDFTSVSATIVCKRDPSHVWQGTVPTSFELVTEPTCEESGAIRHTGILHVDGYEFKQIQLQEIPARGHSWGDITVTWSEDDRQATASRTCAECGKTETETVVTTSELRSEPGCLTDGIMAWMATFDAFDYHMAEKEETLPALGHEYIVYSSAWTDTAEASITILCGRCCWETTMETKEAEISFARRPAASGSGDELVYTATAQMQGQTFTYDRTVPLTEPVSVVAGDQITLTAPRQAGYYRWQYSRDGGNTWIDCASTGHDQATFSFKATAAMNGRLYRCVLKIKPYEYIDEATEVFVLGITKQPTAQNVKEGEKATFTVTAKGNDVTYQWQVNKKGTWNNCTSAGSNTAKFSFTAKASYSGWQYRCVVSSDAGSVTSSAATLTVTPASTKPVITKQPADQTVTAGSKAAFTVTATGDDLTYQWQVNKTGTWTNCTSTGSNTAKFSFTTKASYSGWQYRCKVSNAAGSVTSNAAKLTVGTAGPTITKQPSAQTVAAGSKATFTVTASGDSLTYQWQVNKTGTWANCTSTGCNRASFSFTVKASYSGWQYRCIVTDSTGSTTSNAAKLTVGTAGPTITKQPTAQTVTAGSKATFTVTASGTNLTYQWQVNKTGTWNNCTSTGYDKATFSFTTKASYSGWQYRCIVTDSTGSSTTEAAVLTVN